MRMRKKPNLNLRMEKCTQLLIPEPSLLRGKWREEFPFHDVHIELGCGKGTFAVQTAKDTQQTLFVALEKLTNVLVSALELAMADGLGNIRFINALADNISEYFTQGEASRIYINFCDPWPLDRHAKRRLTHRRYLEQYKQVLRPLGELHFKTDNLDLFEYSLREFDSCGFDIVEAIYDLHKNGTVGIMTEYEKKFHNEGKPIYRGVMVSKQG